MHLYEPILPFRHIHIHVSASLLWKILLLLLILLAAPFLAGCRHHEAVAIASGTVLTLSSTNLAGGRVPKEFTCDGEDKSPMLSWTAPPSGTKSLALIVADPDAPGGTFTHWVLFNLPASAAGLSAALAREPVLPDGSRQGKNDFSRIGYSGPCPPPGNRHRYFFTLYALDQPLDLMAGASQKQLEAAMKGHVLGRGELIARYGR